MLLQLESASVTEIDHLINQVFRAAHSIKGSSGMFGFSQIYELAHKTEWLLDFLRTGKIGPTTDIVDLLLKCFDCLRNLVENPTQSNKIDISEVIKSLDEVLDKMNGKTQTVSDVTSPEGLTPKLFKLPDDEIDTAHKSGWKIFLGKLELIQALDSKGQSLLEFFRFLESFGTIMRCELDFDAFIESEKEQAYALPLEILYCSEMDAAELEDMLEIPPGTLRQFENQYQMTDVPLFPMGSIDIPLSEKSDEAMADGDSFVTSAFVRPPGDVVEETEVIQVQERAEPTLRVKVSLLEDLMNLAGELVLSRNQLREGLNRNDMRVIRISGQRMGQVTTELQETIMMTRLQPLDRVFSKFPRLIRDLSRQLNKEIQLTMVGSEVELDKALIEGLNDPLTHMVRNAVDHGVESPEERVLQGKSNPARIKLQAFYEASRAIIEVSDDGHGIDGEKVCAKAIEKGLLSVDKARGLSEKEKQNLILLPGLSTADNVSELSGRGVGMDVVKANISNLGGKVEISSELGKGSTFRIKLPLTLAIIPSLILSTSGEIFAIPQLNVVEMLLIPAETAKKKIEVIGSQDVLVMRGKLLPLISMNAFLGGERTFIDGETLAEKQDNRKRLADRRSPHYNSKNESQVSQNDAKNLPARKCGRRYHAASDINVVIVTTGNFSFGIVVDKPLFTEEIVVKQLSSDLKGLVEYSGATIMGDGRIALIIDVLGLAARSNIIGQQNSINTAMTEALIDAKNENDTVPFLTFRYGGPQTLVLPLFLVARLEKIQLKNVVSCGGWKAIHHKDKILPVFLISDTSKIEPLRSDQECGVIVVRVRNREIGLVAALPIQVLEMNPNLDVTLLRQPGIGGSKVWNHESVLFVDIWEILARERPELLEFTNESTFMHDKAPQILILEPLDYFQNQLRLQFETHGFSVKFARSWHEINECLAIPGADYKAFFADMNLLQQDNFANIRRLRKEKMLNDIRVVALRNDGVDLSRNLANEGIVEVFQKLENQHLAEWLALTIPSGIPPQN